MQAEQSTQGLHHRRHHNYRMDTLNAWTHELQDHSDIQCSNNPASKGATPSNFQKVTKEADMLTTKKVFNPLS